MSVVINTNVAATVASNNLASSSSSLQRSLNRLSSGSKIVNPSDDAGGLAVSMKMTAAARRSAATNSNIGNVTSYLQTQDGVLKTTAKVLDRMSELHTLYQDPTKNQSDLDNYNAEFNQLQQQVDSLAGETFNGVKLFGSVGGGGDTGVINSVLASEDGVSTSINITKKDLANASTGVGALAAGYTLEGSQQALNEAFTTFQSSDHGGTARTAFDAVASKYLDAGGQTAIDTVVDAYVAADTSIVAGASIDARDAVNTAITGLVAGDIAIGGSTSLADLDLTDITTAIKNVATMRANNGAEQSRLGFAGEVLTVNKSNLEAANSRIVDVDVAEESTQLARWNILVQAGTAMLSQANQSAQSAMRLLQ